MIKLKHSYGPSLVIDHHPGTGEIDQWVKTPVTKFDYLSMSLGTQLIEPVSRHTYNMTLTHEQTDRTTHTHTHTKIQFSKMFMPRR